MAFLLLAMDLYLLRKKSLFRIVCLSLLGIYILLFNTVLGQEKLTLSGYIKDSNSGENLIAAVIRVKDQNLNTYSNNYGFYSLSLPAGTYEVEISFVGYASKTETVELNADQRRNFEITPNSSVIEEVIVTGKKEDDNVTSPQMGNLKFTMEELKIFL
ncbi:carboxypeptidase-like regulatory domain-containing protein [Sphingobacterium daejeonense]|uniref:carboxypeptidase-like regulatory domain-containing protein n=1 Tax=Sphingobacterium daejeonense TaxID=371142 RepID=UPI00293910CF|nr:carboxypeptidase-like regulatory domain-containing protein [Sphingobacterium daejeonense]